MSRVIVATVRHRGGRSLALLLGLLVATGAFAVFTGTSDSQRLVVRGTIAHNFRGSYDILVRPRGTETAVERSEGLVRDNFLSGIFGGITMSQYQRIAHLRGVAVAAPIAMIGYVLEPVAFTLDLTHDLTGAATQLFAVRVERTTDRGLVHVVDQPGYVYVTQKPIVSPNGQVQPPYSGDIEQLASGRHALVCPRTVRRDGTAASTFNSSERGIVVCYSAQTGFDGIGWQGSGFRHGRVGLFATWTFPFLLAAIDPAAEAKLDGVNTAVVGGRYLHGSDKPTAGSAYGAATIDVPVLVSTRPYLDDSDRITVTRVSGRAAGAMVHSPTLTQLDRQISHGATGRVIAQRSIGISEAYRGLLSAISQNQIARIQSYWSSGSPSYRRIGPRAVAPTPVSIPGSVWRSDYTGTGVVDAPIDSELPSYRPLHPHVGIGKLVSTIQLPTLRAVGKFDPARLPGFSPLSRLPQETYSPPVAAPADARTRALLHGADLEPDSNLSGYLQAPPLLLTDLNSLSAFTSRTAFPNGNASDPISVVRVRVAGVHAEDPLSRERVRLVAQRIEQATGLQVDITVGSSPTPVRVDLPASRALPALELSEGWVKKGVAVAILTALDKQSALLFLLILVVCAVFVYNAASAGVQARRSELGALSSLGWRGRDLCGVILGELVLVGLAAGLLGAAIAVPVSAALGFHASPGHALLAIPAALVLAVAAGLAPALRAARMAPAAALRPPVVHVGRAWHARGVVSLGLINLARVPGRNLLAAFSLAIGVGALTVLLAITSVFHDALTGSLLGNALTLQVRSADTAAVIVIVVLAGAGISDVLYINLRERAAEAATLRATGWRDRSLALLVASEALWIGLLGSVLGAALGVVSAGTFAGALPHGLIAVAALAAAAGVIVAVAAATVPAMLIGRGQTVPLLAGE